MPAAGRFAYRARMRPRAPIRPEPRAALARAIACASLAVAVGCSKDTAPAAPSGPTASPDAGVAPPPARCTEAPDPGRPTLRRLNRSEFDRTVRDVLGDDSAPARSFPADDHGHGFDNNGDVLAVSPLLFEKYAVAARELATRAWPRAPGAARRWEAEEVGSTVGAAAGEDWNLFQNGSIEVVLEVEHAGLFELAATAWATEAGDAPARMQLSVDGQPLIGFDVTARREAPFRYVHRSRLGVGAHRVAVAFTNDFWDPDNPDPSRRDRNLLVDSIEAIGPLDAAAEGGVRGEVPACDPAARGTAECSGVVLEAVAREAWRRPITPAERDRLVALAGSVDPVEDGYDVGIRLGIEAILLSPHFLFRVELDPEPTDPTPHALSGPELASRLSYFLWSSAPDAELRRLAEGGQLADSAVLAQQARRMLRDPKAEALVHDFAGQWLYTRALDDVNPDYAIFASWDAELAAAMRAETERVFAELLTADRDALDLLDADFTYVNDRLADHYGWTRPGTSTPTRVELDAGGGRAGILGHGSVLTVTSYPKRTSPVRRGKWVLEQLLCSPPPPPPPGVEGLREGEEATGGTLRERMERHRADPSCAGCHVAMDAIGFGLEGFDGIGAARTADELGRTLDTSGTLPGGASFDGARALASVLRADRRLPYCFADRMLTYALGRGMERADACTVDAVVERFERNGRSLEDLVVAVVTSPAFRERRGEPEDGR